MKLIVGLGNPGSEYKGTRHNIGFQVINQICREKGVRLRGRRFHSLNTRTEIDRKKIILLKPSTFMNRSGIAVRECSDYFKIGLQDILVIHDDLDLPVGRVKLVKNGGAGGHKGVQSIMDHLGEKGFNRVKIGISHPKFGEPTEEYVLSDFYSDQKKIINEVISLSVQSCRLFIVHGIEIAMNRVNRKDLGHGDILLNG